MRRRLFLTLLTLAALPSAALAHHGWGSYDAANPMTLTAVIEEVTIGNPHGMMMLTVEGGMWHVTLAPPSRMNARGATAEVLKPGVEVTAHGYPKKDDTKEIRAEWIEISGKRFELR
jgi:hypothetical protein